MSAAADGDVLAERKTAWQERLEKQKFRFTNERAGLVSSMTYFKGPGMLHVDYDPSKRWRLTFRVTNNDKEVASIKGHASSSFRTFDGVLYFAQFAPSSSGCYLTAHDLSSGKQIWKTEELNGFPGFGHSAYGNEVGMHYSAADAVTEEKMGDALIVKGREGYGDYITVIDRKTGEVLARKIYREKFARYSEKE